MRAQRIVSLLPSATTISVALGFPRALVGRSHECDYPASIQHLPAVTAPKFEPDGTSYEIDQRVKAVLQEALSVYRVDAELLRALRPQVIVTQSQCEVCAVSERDVEAAVCDWLDDQPRIVSLAPNALADVWADIERVAAALGAPEEGTTLADGLRRRVEQIAAEATALPDRPRVACIEWLEPLMAAGNWMPELVTMAGGVNLFGEAGMHSPWMAWDDLVAADPDVIVILPCGFDIVRSTRELGLLTRRPGWKRLGAVRSGRVYLTDGNQYFNRPGPRLVESLEILAEVLHPGRFRFGHEGRGWQPLLPLRRA